MKSLMNSLFFQLPKPRPGQRPALTTAGLDQFLQRQAHALRHQQPALGAALHDAHGRQDRVLWREVRLLFFLGERASTQHGVCEAWALTDRGGPAGSARAQRAPRRLTWGSNSRDSGGWLSRNRVTGVSRCSSSTTAQSGEKPAITFTRASARGKRRHHPQPRARPRNGTRPLRSGPAHKMAAPRTAREMAPARAPGPSRTHGDGRGASAWRRGRRRAAGGARRRAGGRRAAPPG